MAAPGIRRPPVTAPTAGYAELLPAANMHQLFNLAAGAALPAGVLPGSLMLDLGIVRLALVRCVHRFHNRPVYIGTFSLSSTSPAIHSSDQERPESWV